VVGVCVEYRLVTSRTTARCSRVIDRPPAHAVMEFVTGDSAGPVHRVRRRRQTELNLLLGTRRPPRNSHHLMPAPPRNDDRRVGLGIDRAARPTDLLGRAQQIGASLGSC